MYIDNLIYSIAESIVDDVKYPDKENAFRNSPGAIKLAEYILQNFKPTIEKEEIEDKDCMVTVGGSNFKCDCGCNVFRKFKNNRLRYKCNSCKSTYTGEN